MIHSLKRTLFDSLYHESFLPPLWQVLFHEGNRANHLMFADVDTDQATIVALSDDNTEQVCEAVLGILQAHNVTKMREIILALKGIERGAVFQLYLRFLAHYREEFRQRLN